MNTKAPDAIGRLQAAARQLLDARSELRRCRERLLSAEQHATRCEKVFGESRAVVLTGLGSAEDERAPTDDQLQMLAGAA